MYERIKKLLLFLAAGSFALIISACYGSPAPQSIVKVDQDQKMDAPSLEQKKDISVTN